MENKVHEFIPNAAKAIEDAKLQSALKKLESGLQARRAESIARLPDFESLRERGSQIKRKTIANLAGYLETFEKNVQHSGGQVHWASDANEACKAITEICRAVDAKNVVKGKSMVTEEIALNEHLHKEGINAIETDLGEYILQLRGEAPSHIVVPAFHIDKADISNTFRQSHGDLNSARSLDSAEEIISEARLKMRDHFTQADVGITGANFLVAETGTAVIVTNEGNGDLSQNLPKVHIVVTTIEKIVPTLDNTAVLLRLLSRSATGQDATAYVTFASGPREIADLDGPDQFHVVLLDNGRSELVGTDKEEVLKCIRCGACMNHCPVYAAVGGHSYGWVYPGPIGAAITPGLIGAQNAAHLPNASTFCGRCNAVCPVKIPLTNIMRSWRETISEEKPIANTEKIILLAWSWTAKHARIYRFLTGLAIQVLAKLGNKKGYFRYIPFLDGWTKWRDLPAPEGKTFYQQYNQQRRKNRKK